MAQPSGRPARLLPLQPAPFIGRADELAEISGLLANPACRLLTLLGPGGIGKTRLAVEVAARLADEDFIHGIYFISLQAISLPDRLAPTIAAALNFPLSGQADAASQLVNYLRDRNLLLVLDNLEQLLGPVDDGPGAVELLAGILAAAPDLKLLVTSREVLNLQSEWLYPVTGLSYPVSPLPGETREDSLSAFSAVQLFVDRAGRVRRDFSPAGQLADIIRICQLVEGVPLALELAASWAKTLSCSEIAAEIRRNIDFLTTSLRDIPDRQRSLRAVFERSWALLGPAERSVFSRLSVFRGGCQREAAERVAGASLATLAALADKSLVRAEPGGRYHIHELLRQYAAEQLLQRPDDLAYIYDDHCAYYLDFLARRHADLVGGRQLEAMAEVEEDLENIRAAWEWATAGRKVEQIAPASHSLAMFYQFKGRYREAADMYERAAERLHLAGSPGVALAQVLVDLGLFYIRLGRLDEAQAAMEQGQAIYTGLGLPPSPGQATDPLIGLAILALIRGDYAAAARLGEESRRLNETHGLRGNLPFADYVLAQAALARGDYDLAGQHARRAYAMVEEIGNRWFIAYLLNELGNVAGALGQVDEARQHYRASYAIRETFGDPEGMAVALNHLGQLALRQGDAAEARRLYRQSLAIYRELNDRGGLATSLLGLGTAAGAGRDYRAAWQRLGEALAIAAEINFVPLALAVLARLGNLLRQAGRPEQGLALLAFVGRHPAADLETRDQARQDLDRTGTAPGPETGSGDLAGMVAFALAEVKQVSAEMEKQASGQPVTSLQPVTAPGSSLPVLVEPLTAREQEVLELIAAGLTNQQIADQLIISVGTVKSYTSQIYGKLGVSSRTQAVACARELNLLP